MLEDKLELLLITYNRAPFLENTLAQLLAGPFARCRLTVLDNCSTDETPEVCQRFQPRFRDMRIVRHRNNIGASPNYLRAVELSQSPFTWVLGDDDSYDFSDCGDVLQAIESEQYDLISVGSPAQEPSERGAITSSRALVEAGTRYFSSFTYLNGVIFRTALFDSECFFHGYRNAINLYPHFPFVYKSVREDFSVFTSRSKLVHRNNRNEDHLTYFPWFRAWVHSCSLIDDKPLRRKAIYDFSYRSLRFRTTAYAVAQEKANGREVRWRGVLSIWFILCREQKLLWMAYLPLFLTPAVVYRLARDVHKWIYHNLRGNPLGQRQAYDPFRL